MSTAIGTDAAPNSEWSGKGTWRAGSVDLAERHARFQAHMAELRTARQGLANRNSCMPPGLQRMTHLSRLQFDPARWPLREAFLAAIGMPADTDLRHLHHLVPGLGNTAASGLKPKLRLLAPLADPVACRGFVDSYTAFVLGVVAPMFGQATGDSRLLFQAFPCVRISQPCDFATIRPHIDQAYGHPWGSVNAWLPLTSANSNNTLHIESAPGLEDFQPVEAEYSQLVLGDMNSCAHFTVPNSSGATRVSLDFRIVPWSCWKAQDIREVPYLIGQYYSVLDSKTTTYV
eukprot:jgi/Tetstr1/454490/TSEL_041390.t1